jgi:hypothetical protein
MKTNSSNNDVMFNTLYVDVLANALKNAISESNGQNAKKIFENLKSYKSENEKGSAEIQKYFNNQFSKLEIAIAKQLTKYNADKVTASSESAKEQLNILSLPITEQRAKIRGMLNNMAKSGKYEMYFTKKQYLEMFDILTDDEFTQLYCGKSIEKSSLIRVLTNKLIKAEKNNK